VPTMIYINTLTYVIRAEVLLIKQIIIDLANAKKYFKTRDKIYYHNILSYNK